jgi:hypothetical protein
LLNGSPKTNQHSFHAIPATVIGPSFLTKGANCGAMLWVPLLYATMQDKNKRKENRVI